MTNYWLVYQNEETFKLESDGEYLFGGLTSEGGAKIYDGLKELKEGDI